MYNLTELPEGVKQQWSEFLQRAIREESQWTQIAFVVSLFFVFAVGMLGNLLTCIVIYYERTMHTATNYYLFNMAVTDLFVSFAILLEIHEHMSDTYQFGDLFCKIHFFLVIALWNNSILIMTALSIERYIAIWHPMLLNSTPVWRRVIKVIILLWVVAILEATPELWSLELVKSPRVPKSAICFTIPSNFARIANGVQALLTFIIPLLVMTFVYGMIAFKVNAVEKKNSRDKIFNHRDNRSKVNGLIALTVSFLACWLPFFTMRVLTCAYDVRRLMHAPQWWGLGFKFVALNSWFSIVLNPLLFSLMSTKFRKALKGLWKSKFKRSNSQSLYVGRTTGV